MSDGGVAESRVVRRRRSVLGLSASAVLILIAIVLALQDGGTGDDRASADGIPRFVAASDLAELEGSIGHQVYWAGERPSDRVEITEEADGSVYLRYLPPGAEAGDSPAEFLTVGTYPVVDAAEALRRTAENADVELDRTADGAVLLVNPSSPGSVYFAYPGADLQIEVYDPAPGRALRLIRAGAIQPAG